MKGAVDKRKGLECFVSAQMLMLWCTLHEWWLTLRQSMMLWLIFFQITIIVRRQWNEEPRSTYAWKWHANTNLIQELQFFMIPILISILRGLILILILIPIPVFTKIYDSDSNSDSSSKWFRFWFRFQCFPKTLDSDSDSNSSITWFRFQFQQTRLWFRFWFRNLIPIPESFTTLMPTNFFRLE